MTNILAWLNPGRWLMLLAAAGALTLGYAAWKDYQQDIGEARANAKWQIATEQLKSDAKTKLAEETDKVRKLEQALQDFKNQQEIKDARNRNTVAGLAGRIRELSATSGRLRDPNAETGCGSSDSSAESKVSTAANNSSINRTKAGGLLSVQLSDLLSRLLREADEINTAYISCRADSYNLRQQPDN